MNAGPLDMRRVHLACFAGFYLLSQAGMIVYRDYVYRHGIRDFGLADTAGNLFGVGVVAFFILLIAAPGARGAAVLICGSTLWLALHEFAQMYLPDRVFDWRDVVATAVGGALALLVHRAAGRARGFQ